jgi:hypothetical protein
MKNMPTALASRKANAERRSGTVIEAEFPEELDGQQEEQIPISIRFLSNRERLWKGGRRSWDWRAHDCESNLVLVR